MPASAVHRILVPVDFSPCSRAALDYAAELADRMNAGVEVLYVHEPASAASAASMFAPPEARGPEWDETRTELERQVAGFLGPMRGRVRDVRVESGLAADVIPNVARQGRFDLIVMGTHGRGGVSRVVVGSVAEVVMKKAQVPVLTLRMPRKEPRESIPL